MRNNNKLFTYRKEIDGLRAIAVIPVIFFHSKLPFFNGGFIGVDVFFVISGFLITSLILNEYRSNTFSLINFYERRARRILPALFTIVFFTLFLSFFYMLPYELVDYSKSVISTLFFSSNFYFWSQEGYFSPNSDMYPLLHTWSLGIEEQFYILFPVFFIFCLSTIKYNKIFILLILISLLSLLFAQFSGNLKTIFPYYEKNFIFFSQSYFASFYLPFGRIWELLFGCLISLYFNNLKTPNIAINNCLSLFGFCMILLSIFLFSDKTPYPSFFTLIPVIGTGLVLICTNSKTFLFKLLTIKYLVLLGLISYSLYLWHQPVLVFTKFAIGDEIKNIHLTFIFLLILFLSLLSWKFIELPFRNKQIISRRKLIYILVISIMIITTFSYINIYKNGFIDRYSKSDLQLVKYSPNTNERNVIKIFNKLKNNKFKEDKINILIIGDSHAQDFTNILFKSDISENLNFKTIYISSRCQIYYNPNKLLNDNVLTIDKYLCLNGNLISDIIGEIRKFDYVFFASNWRKWSAEALTRTITSLNLDNNNKLIIVGPKDFGNINIREYLNQSLNYKINLWHLLSEDIININNILKRASKNNRFIDIVGSICSKDYSCPKFNDEGMLLSYDGGHLTSEGASYISKKIFSDNLDNYLTKE